MAQYDDDAVVVYQAYKPSIARFAIEHGYFGGEEYKLSRMTWVKPNFLWMMHRAGWGTKEGQEVILAIWLKRSAFDSMLTQAIHSRFIPTVYATYQAWRQAVDHSDVRLQWDPDYSPDDQKLMRRAIQLGLQGEVAKQYAQGGWIVHLEDVSAFAASQYDNATPNRYEHLLLPRERVYPVENTDVSQRLQISVPTGQ
jgi:hypothetical protein